MNCFNLDNKRVLVTGACGYLGKNICGLFENNGAIVYRVDKVANDDTLYLDISKRNDVSCFVDSLIELHNEIKFDGIVNNAAISFKGFDLTEDEFIKTLNINVSGANNIILEFNRILNKNASIVNISSIYGFLTPDFSIYDGNESLFNSCAYGCSKAALLQLTRYYARILGKNGIRVNSVSPGGIFQEHCKDFVEKYSKRVPLGRMADPNEISNVVLFLLSDLSSYISGANIPVTGGIEI